jgi:hypothetical protein
MEIKTKGQRRPGRDKGKKGELPRGWGTAGRWSGGEAAEK